MLGVREVPWDSDAQQLLRGVGAHFNAGHTFRRTPCAVFFGEEGQTVPDPYFDGWPDTLQLNYRHGGFREAMKGILARIAGMADGKRGVDFITVDGGEGGGVVGLAQEGALVGGADGLPQASQGDPVAGAAHDDRGGGGGEDQGLGADDVGVELPAAVLPQEHRVEHAQEVLAQGLVELAGVDEAGVDHQLADALAGGAGDQGLGGVVLGAAEEAAGEQAVGEAGRVRPQRLGRTASRCDQFILSAPTRCAQGKRAKRHASTSKLRMPRHDGCISLAIARCSS